MALNKSNITGGQHGQTLYFETIDFKIAKITFYAAIFILSCVGNSFVAIVIVGAKDMRTPSNFLILNLALCDFVTPALGIPFDLALEESNYIWPFGRGFCKVLWPFETAISVSSSLSPRGHKFGKVQSFVKSICGSDLYLSRASVHTDNSHSFNSVVHSLLSCFELQRF